MRSMMCGKEEASRSGRDEQEGEVMAKSIRGDYGCLEGWGETRKDWKGRNVRELVRRAERDERNEGEGTMENAL